MNHDTWTAESLTHLLVSNGMARRLIRRGPLFVPADPLPQSGRPGEPQHPDTPCLVWTGCILGGRGRLGTQRARSRLVHVITFELVHGPVPDGMLLAHRCEQAACGRPDHVRPATNRENLREGPRRRYPDWLVGRAPETPCPQCSGRMGVTVRLSKRPAWHMTCYPCLTQKHVGMTDSDIVALRLFLG